MILPVVQLVANVVALCSWTSLIPSQAVIADAFRAPACERCPGNRGLEFAITPTDGRMLTPVVALRDGSITFAGSVARTVYVVQRVAPGVSITYGRLFQPAVARDDHVRRGETLGWATERLYVGVRIRGHYVNPRVGLAVTTPVLVPSGAKSVVCSTVQSEVGARRPP